MIKHARFNVGKWPYHLVDNEFHNDNDNDNNNEFHNDRLSDWSGRSFHFNAATFQGNEAGESF